MEQPRIEESGEDSRGTKGPYKASTGLIRFLGAL